MNKLSRLILLALVIVLAVPVGVRAQALDGNPTLEVIPEELSDPALVEPHPEKFYRGEVVAILEEREEDLGLGQRQSTLQRVKVLIKEGPRQGEEAVIEYGSLSDVQKLKVGMPVIVVAPQNVDLFIFDRYRLPALGVITVIFGFLVLIFAGWRGLGSLAGLGISVIVLVKYVVPQIMAGSNPFIVSLIAAFFISVISIYLAHGLNRRTTIAIGGILVTVLIAMGLAQLFVQMASLTGTGSEEAFFLQTSPAAFINLRGLLLGGIIIGVLGILDDITTAQAAAVYEIWQANPRLSRRELYRRSMAVGREHIASLINTLALAYVGASFPALLLFTVYQRPWWVVANTENIAEEIVRTLVGSSALMMAVPITTLLAVYWIPKGKVLDSGQE